MQLEDDTNCDFSGTETKTFAKTLKYLNSLTQWEKRRFVDKKFVTNDILISKNSAR